MNLQKIGEALGYCIWQYKHILVLRDRAIPVSSITHIAHETYNHIQKNSCKEQLCSVRASAFWHNKH